MERERERELSKASNERERDEFGERMKIEEDVLYSTESPVKSVTAR